MLLTSQCCYTQKTLILRFSKSAFENFLRKLCSRFKFSDVWNVASSVFALAIESQMFMSFACIWFQVCAKLNVLIWRGTFLYKRCMIKTWCGVQEWPLEWKSDPLYTIILSWYWRWQALIVSSASHWFIIFLLLLLNQSYSREYSLQTAPMMLPVPNFCHWATFNFLFSVFHFFILWVISEMKEIYQCEALFEVLGLNEHCKAHHCTTVIIQYSSQISHTVWFNKYCMCIHKIIKTSMSTPEKKSITWLFPIYFFTLDR